MNRFNITLFVLLIIGAFQLINANVIGIDFGTQTFKIGLIKPGAFETVLNEASGRKTINSVGWYNGERVFASDSYSLWVRNPKQVYQLSELLLGKEYSDEILQEIGQGTLGYKVANDQERRTFSIVYDSDSEISYSPEEINGMLFRKIKDLASIYSASTIKDCVIAVPAFFNQQQRQAILDSAALAGLNVLSLINDVNAAAINLAMDKNFLEENQTVVFYDMGFKSTKLSLVQFSSFNEVNKVTKKTQVATNVIVKNLEWEENLGGFNFDMVIVNYLKGLIQKQKPNVDVNDVKITIKLAKEASKMKETLSVNQQAHVFIGSLVDEWDFQASITRQQFEELSKDLLIQSVEPVKRLLADAGLQPKDIHLFEVIGGSIRIPAVQQVLKTFMEREVLDKHLNGDESISSGSSFFAASLTSYFRVKDIRLKDITPASFEINIIKEQQHNEILEENSIEENNENNETTTTEALSNNQQQLFKRYNRLGFKKTMKFYSNSSVTLDLSYAGKEQPLLSYIVGGLPVPSAKLNFTGKPKIVCHFRLNSNGLVTLEKAEAEVLVSAVRIKNNTKSILEFKPTPIAQPITTNEDGGSGEAATATASEETQEKEEIKEQEEQKEYIETEVYTKVHSVPLEIQINYHSVVPLSKETLKLSKTKLDDLDRIDDHLKSLRKEKNNLESFIYETRDKLDSDEVIQHSTQEERDQLNEDLTKSSNWLEDAEMSSNNKVEEYKNQFSEIKKKSQKIFNRIDQRSLIPVGLDELTNLIKKVKPTLINITKDLNITDGDEISESINRIDGIAKWVESKKEELESTDLTKDIPFTAFEIKMKLMEFERLMKDITLKKKKKTTPPPKPSTKKADKESTSKPEESQKQQQQEQQQEQQQQQQQQEQEVEEPQQTRPNQQDEDNTGSSEEIPINTHHDEL